MSSSPQLPARSRRRFGCFGCLLNAAVILAFGAVLALAIIGIFAPWGFYMGGEFHILPYWQGWGTLNAKSGNYVLYTFFGPSSRGSRILRRSNLTGNAYLCTPRGEKFRLRLGGSMRRNPDLRVDGEAIGLYMNYWPAFYGLFTAEHRPSIQLRGHWKNPNLEMDDDGSISNNFQRDGSLYTGHEKSRPYSTEIVPVTLMRGSYSDFERACSAVAHR
jgi:hypothetical protein